MLAYRGILYKKNKLSLFLKMCIVCGVLVSHVQAVIAQDVLLEEPLQTTALEMSMQKAWYAVRFNIPWAKDQEPQWYLGTLLAGEFIGPVLQQSGDKLSFWRAHRRAVRDAIGHQFSFIFYTTQADAASIYQQFKDNKLLSLAQQQFAIAVKYDALVGNTQVNIEDTSDPVWADKIRRSWPFFIKGVSQMWLAQIDDFKQETSTEQGWKLRYKEIQNKITELWAAQGEHAYIHHLSAVYAYEPLHVRF